MKARGTVHKYGDNVDTDVIIPARYLNSTDPKELVLLVLLQKLLQESFTVMQSILDCRLLNVQKLQKRLKREMM